MRTARAAITFGALAVGGCGTTASQIAAAAKGNVIVIAVQDLRGTNGRVMSDNAGGIPDALGRALGIPIGPAVGAALNLAIGTTANAAANQVAETTRPIALKVISEESCQDWAHVVVRTVVSPQTDMLRPGSIARVRQETATGQVTVVPVMATADAPAYLTKSHRCYGPWVAEWKEHQRIVSNRLPWGNHRGNDPLFGGVKLSNIAEPAYYYIR